MSFQLYKIENKKVQQLKKKTANLEKEIQKLFENNLQEIFGITFLRSEYAITDKYGGRMDTIGIDENNSPVILEYKRTTNENIINQALFYLDWLMDHKGDFELIAREAAGNDIEIDWFTPRVICIAEQFNKYDKYAVSQMGRPIELIQYQIFENDFLGIDILTSIEGITYEGKKEVTEKKEYDVNWHTKKGTNLSNELFKELQEFILSLGEDVVESPQKFYIAYRTIRNFACIEIHKKHLLIYLSIDPDKVNLDNEILRNVRKIGHFGTGDIEIRIEKPEHINTSKELLEKAYNFIS